MIFIQSDGFSLLFLLSLLVQLCAPSLNSTSYFPFFNFGTLLFIFLQFEVFLFYLFYLRLALPLLYGGKILVDAIIFASRLVPLFDQAPLDHHCRRLSSLFKNLVLIQSLHFAWPCLSFIGKPKLQQYQLLSQKIYCPNELSSSLELNHISQSYPCLVGHPNLMPQQSSISTFALNVQALLDTAIRIHTLHADQTQISLLLIPSLLMKRSFFSSSVFMTLSFISLTDAQFHLCILRNLKHSKYPKYQTSPFQLIIESPS